MEGDRWATARPVLEALRQYRQARQALLDHLGLSRSNRDPLAEVSEHLVAALLGGTLAASPVQRGWDLCDPEGRAVQVRYLANPAGVWVNEHLVDFRPPEVDRYALVLFEALDPKAVLIFERAGLPEVCGHLGKRHSNQDVTLQFTRANYLKVCQAPDLFRRSGLELVQVPTT